MTENTIPPDRISSEVNELMKLTCRVDERVQTMIKHQTVLENKIDAQTNLFNELNTKVKFLELNSGDEIFEDMKKVSNDLHQMELRLLTIENSQSKQEDRWKTVFGFVIQLIWVILAAFLLYKLGIQAPPVP